MSGIVVVKNIDRDARRVDVIVYPESCGRCEENGGHCSRTHREVPVHLPDSFSVSVGDRVRLGSSRQAVIRAIWRLVLLPLLGSLLGGTALWAITGIELSALSGNALISLVGGVIFGGAIPLAWAVFTGAGPADWPIILEPDDAEAREEETAPLSLSAVTIDSGRVVHS